MKSLSLALSMLLGACAGQAHADTMYKCVDGAGKVAYTSTPCQGKVSQAKAFSVAAPLDNASLAAAEAKRLKELSRVKDGIEKRAADRQASDAREAYAYGSGAAMMPGAPKAKPVPSRVQRTPEEDERDSRLAETRKYCRKRDGANPMQNGCF